MAFSFSPSFGILSVRLILVMCGSGPHVPVTYGDMSCAHSDDV